MQGSEEKTLVQATVEDAGSVGAVTLSLEQGAALHGFAREIIELAWGIDGYLDGDDITRCAQEHGLLEAAPDGILMTATWLRVPLAEIERLRGAVTLPVCQWRDMASAPKDGTRVLIKAVTFGWNSNICQHVATGDKAVEARWTACPVFGSPPDWREWQGNARTSSTDGPLVHLGWMPLPPSPDDRTDTSGALDSCLNQRTPTQETE